MLAHICALAGVLLFVAPAAALDVVVVDESGGPGTDFTSIQPAIDAASEGDVVVVRPGDYAGFTVTGKSLTVVGFPYATVFTPPVLEVRVGRSSVADLSNSQVFVVSGIDLTAGFVARDCDGEVLLNACVVGTVPILAQPTVLVERCTNFVLSGVSFGSPNPGALLNSSGQVGLLVRDSTVHAFGTAVRGGTGQSPTFQSQSPGKGGYGVLLERSQLRGDQLWIEGGVGGPGLGACIGGKGGSGLGLDVGSSAEIADPTIVGGAGGPPGDASPNCVQGPSGLPIQMAAGTQLALFGKTTYPFFTAPVVSEGEPLWNIFATDCLNCPAFLLLSNRVAPLDLDLATGVLLGAPLVILPLGITDADGWLFGTSFPTGNLPPGVDAVTLVKQLAVLRPDSTVNLTHPTHTTVLDSSF